ncbi:MAG: hypothetical protein COA79_23315 [Planctomycetota bacterium]|nr:MAG: hypothetical protein COA79_23315 [Planctomycetota bacterium]
MYRRRIIRVAFAIFIIFYLSSCSSVDSTDTPIAPPEATTYDVSGCIQKGPFISGSRVTIQELKKNLTPTGKVYETSTNDDFGSFELSNNFNSKFVEIITNGFYFNEVTGSLSTANLTLRTLSKLSVNKNFNVNILTTLSRERIEYLVVKQEMLFEDAELQAETEILSLFHIQESETLRFNEMDISEDNESSAILLAISVILQGDISVPELSEFIAKLILDLKEDGVVNNSDLLDQIRNNSIHLNLPNIRTNTASRYSSLGLVVNIPNFENYVDSDGDGKINKFDYTLLSPINTINNTMPRFDWTDSNLPDAKYHFQVASDSNFKTIIDERNNLTDSEYTILETLDNNATYYWRVFVQDNGNEYIWDGYKTFTVDLGIISLINPIGEIVNTKPVLDWSDCELRDATYHLQLASDDSFTNIVEDVYDLSSSTYSSLSSTLNTSDTYYWRVSVVDENRIEGNWTEPYIFTVDFGIISLLNPSGVIINTKPDLDWSDSDLSNVTYNFQLSTDDSFTNIVEDVYDLSSSTYSSLSSALNTSDTYYWRVSVVDENRIEGNWTEPYIFTVDLNSVTLNSPTNMLYTNEMTPTFKWEASPNAASYNLIISTSSNLSNPLVEVTEINEIFFSLNTPLDSTDSTNYFWAVTPVDANGVSGTLSDTWSFILDTTPPTGSILINNGEENTSNETVQLTISATDTNSVLQMYISKDGSFTDGVWEDYSTSSQIAFTDNASEENATLIAYAKFKDTLGNISSAFSDEIQLSRNFKSGVISSDETWHKADSPFIINGDVGVASGATLTIEPSVTIKYVGSHGILIKGTLIANGTIVDKIVFTTYIPEVLVNLSMLKFEGTNLSNSQLSNIKMEYAKEAIRVGDESELIQAPIKNNGTLTVTNIDLLNAGVTTDGYSTSAKLVLNNATIDSSLVLGTYPRSEPIEINNSVITNSTVKSDSYNKGIDIYNSNLSNSHLIIGCCNATIHLEKSTFSTGTIREELNVTPVNGPIEIIDCELVNVSIDLSSATATISDSIFTYNNYFSGANRIRIGAGTMNYSRVVGNGVGVGVAITGNAGYNTNGSFIITYSDIIQNSIGVSLKGGSGSFSSTNSNIYQNTLYNIENKKANNVTATNSYWGTILTSEIDVLLYDGNDNLSYGIVDYSTYLSTLQAGTGPR